MKISITVDVDFDEQHEIQHPLLHRILDVFRGPMEAKSLTVETSAAAEQRRGRPRRQRAGAARTEQHTDTEDLAEIEVDAAPAGNGAVAEQPAKREDAEAAVSAEATPASDQEEAESAAISAGDYALIAAGLRPAPTSRAEDEQAALLAEAAFEFDRVVSVFGRPAALDVSRNALPDGVKFVSIEALTAAQVPAVLAALRGLV